MKVTDITPQKHNKSRVSVYLDGKYAFSLDEVDAYRLRIKVGSTLTDEDVQRCNLESNLSKAISKAADILSRKPATAYEITSKLRSKGYDDSVISVAVAELQELGYINDYDYAKIYLDYAGEKFYGTKKIRYELEKKGIDPYIIEDVLDERENTDSIALKEHIYAKYGSVDMSDMKMRNKVMRYLISRGFDFSQANDAVKEYIKQQEEQYE